MATDWLQDELEESRWRRREADERAVADAEEYVKQFTALRPAPPPAVRPAPQQDNRINWGQAIGEALGNIGGTVAGKLVDEPEPVAPAVEPPLPTPTLGVEYVVRTSRPPRRG